MRLFQWVNCFLSIINGEEALLVQEKEVISTGQFIWILIAIIAAPTSLSIPGDIILQTQQDSWLSVIGAWFLDVLLALVYAYMGLRFPGKNFVQYSSTILGKYIGKIVGGMFPLFFLFVSVGVMWDLSRLITLVFLPQTPIEVILICGYIVVGYGAHKGIEVVVRNAEFMAPMFVFSIVSLGLLLIPSIKIEQLKPQLIHGIYPIISGSFYIVTFYGICIMMGMFIPICNRPENGFLAKFTAVSIGSFVVGIIIVVSIAVFGVEQSKVLIYPGLELSKIINIGDFSDIVSEDSGMSEAISFAKRAATLDISLFISGESGTGKELFAQSIHGASLRNNKPFIALNCSAIPESLLESELFGYEKGAFTGANNSGQVGKFEAADGGTLFLDEIGDMSLPAQATLLRVLQEHAVTRIGGINPRPIDVRIIAATHKNLQEEIAAGRFRADLYYRLNGFTIKLPALRERSDLVLLAGYILSRIPFKKEETELTEDAKTFIREYEWPGNFRQLQNVLQQATFMANQKQITKEMLTSICPISSNSTNEREQPEMTGAKSLQEHEVNAIKQVLQQTKGNISHAAKQLNIGRNTLYRKLKAYNLIS